MKIFYSMKHLLRKIKKWTRNWKRLFSKHTSDNWSALKLYQTAPLKFGKDWYAYLGKKDKQ